MMAVRIGVPRTRSACKQRYNKFRKHKASGNQTAPLAQANAITLMSPLVKRLWTEEEDAALKELCSGGRTSWREISRALYKRTGIQRTAGSCRLRYHRYARFGTTPRPSNAGVLLRHKWTKEQKELLLSLYAEGKSIATISARLHRTMGSCGSQLYKLTNQKLYASRKWTREEDDHVRREIEKYSQETKIGRPIDRAPGRVQLRWECALDPSTKRGAWTLEEDSHLLRSLQEHTRGLPISWKAIGKPISRLGSSVQSRYRKILCKV